MAHTPRNSDLMTHQVDVTWLLCHHFPVTGEQLPCHTIGTCQDPYRWSSRQIARSGLFFERIYTWGYMAKPRDSGLFFERTPFINGYMAKPSDFATSQFSKTLLFRSTHVVKIKKTQESTPSWGKLRSETKRKYPRIRGTYF